MPSPLKRPARVLRPRRAEPNDYMLESVLGEDFDMDFSPSPSPPRRKPAAPKVASAGAAAGSTRQAQSHRAATVEAPTATIRKGRDSDLAGDVRTTRTTMKHGNGDHQPAQTEGLENLIGQIHQNVLGCVRCAKATAELGRAAGQFLEKAQELVGNGRFDRWVDTALAITPEDAKALMTFCGLGEIQMADVSPVVSVTLPRAVQLLSRLCAQFPGRASDDCLNGQRKGAVRDGHVRAPAGRAPRAEMSSTRTKRSRDAKPLPR